MDPLQTLFGGSESQQQQESNAKSKATSRSQQSSYGYDVGGSQSTGASTSQQTSQSSSIDLTPEAFKNLQAPAAGAAASMLGTPGNPLGGIPGVGGPMAAPITGNEQTLLGQLMNRGQGAQSLLDQTMAGQFLPGQAGANPFLQAAIQSAQRPTLQGLEETLSRALPGLFTRGGHMVQFNPNTGEGGSSAFQRAAAIASRGAADALSDIATKMSFQGYEAERGRQQEAVGMDQSQTKVMMDTLNAQALPRLIEQMGIDNGMKEYQARINAVLSVLQSAAQMASPTLGQQATSQGTSQSAQQATSFNTGEQASQGTSQSKSVSRSHSEGSATSESQNPWLRQLFPVSQA